MRVVCILTAAQPAGTIGLSTIGITYYVNEHKASSRFMASISRGSMWRSDKCNTLRRCPVGSFGEGSGLGFGLENQPLRSRGEVVGRGHNPRNSEQIS